MLMDLGLGLGLDGGEEGGGAGGPLYRIAATNQRKAGFVVPVASSRRAGQFEIRHTIGSGGYSALKLVFVNWGWNVSPPSEIDNTSPVYIDKFSLQNNARNINAPVTFGGARTATIPAGALEFHSDLILPSAFGLSQFSEADIYRFRGQFHVATDADKFMGREYAGTGLAYVYDPATTTPVTDIDALSAINSTGLTLATGPLCFFVVGIPLDDTQQFVGCMGDSIATNVDDTGSGAVTLNGNGFFFRGCVDADRVANPRSAVNLSIPGWTSVNWVDATRNFTFLKYVTTLVTQPGVNDFQLGVALETTKANLLSLWATARAAGVRKIVHAQVMTKTSSSSNNYIDAAGQTVAPRFGAGEDADLLRAWVASRVGQEIDAIITMDGVCDPGDRHKWLTSGVANANVADGIHPKTPLHVIAGDETRTVLATLD